jgi:hypothetical protein
MEPDFYICVVHIPIHVDQMNGNEAWSSSVETAFCTRRVLGSGSAARDKALSSSWRKSQDCEANCGASIFEFARRLSQQQQSNFGLSPPSAHTSHPPGVASPRHTPPR